ncbi:hypothetical protein [Methanobrevibacter sp.]|uniref:hypothetical protein n=1 Tax=Methanobrevibacter sp. TaxID=66852 RepID=UPI00386DCD21
MCEFIEVAQNVFVDELDVKQAFKEAEIKLDVLNFEVSSDVIEFTLSSVLSGRKFSHLTDFEKGEIIKHIVEFY